jgi:hypothetical protein
MQLIRYAIILGKAKEWPATYRIILKAYAIAYLLGV